MTELQRLSKKIDNFIQSQDKPLNIEEACKYLNVSKPTMYKLTHNRKIPHYKPNGLIYFKRSELDLYAFSNKIEAVK